MKKLALIAALSLFPLASNAQEFGTSNSSCLRLGHSQKVCDNAFPAVVKREPLSYCAKMNDEAALYYRLSATSNRVGDWGSAADESAQARYYSAKADSCYKTATNKTEAALYAWKLSVKNFNDAYETYRLVSGQ